MDYLLCVCAFGALQIEGSILGAFSCIIKILIIRNACGTIIFYLLRYFILRYLAWLDAAF